jgi:hypothetical protein
MVQVELNSMYVNMGANNGSEKIMNKKNTATSDKLIKAVYTSYVYVYISCTSWSGRLEQCFSTAGTRPSTGPWHQLYRAARCSGICHFSFLSIFHE